jgi:hypothetical protein
MVTKLALLDIPQADLRKTFEVSDGSKSSFFICSSYDALLFSYCLYFDKTANAFLYSLYP